jgi:SAM-dependent methyltransferase
MTERANKKRDQPPAEESPREVCAVTSTARTDVAADIDRTRSYWERQASDARNDAERVDWHPRPQRMRFAVFTEMNDVAGKSVLDVGCGLGDLWLYLQHRRMNCEYVGFDISSEMVRRCRERFQGVRFESGNILEWDAGHQFDYVVSIGIHNKPRVDHGLEVLDKITRRQFELCRVAAHLSLLTDRYDGFGRDIQSWTAERVLSMALTITPYVVLRHDYLPNDFSLTLYREPLIDTHRELVDDQCI